ncbi:MAG: 4-hydroxythreonine-4-phosphate dehydrogenase PdxA [Leptospiraceae bacterium]|nr:4-hydroxythreonine-4-phosphate dehydrogenase PdxA [Leptospiraceae bacterium]MDW8306746.1 4-hydroxythreonine-4-phosphate dehydrogenase PdxA [Leptospiraceae bacterium]
MPGDTSKSRQEHYIVISQGDVAGVAYPLLLQVLKHSHKYFTTTEVAKLKNIILIGDLFEKDEKILRQLFLLEEIPPNSQAILHLMEKRKTKKPLFLFSQKARSYESGKPSTGLALRAYHNFQQSLKIASALPAASLLTLPLSKEYIQKAGIAFWGHTEVLANYSKEKVFMCLYHPQLSVIPLTNHIPLAKVPKKILETDFVALAHALFFFRQFTKTKKKFGLTGLNPHAGEGGKLGDEEGFLSQGIQELSRHGVSVEGPLSADGAFSLESRKAYSLLITCYHDQGLAPFKALFGLRGINITLNLPFLRVSPDHGTAYQLAKEGKGNPLGVVTSLRFAIHRGALWKKVYSSL